MTGLGVGEILILLCFNALLIGFVAIVLQVVLLHVRPVNRHQQGLKTGEAASGDLAGSYPAPQLVSLRGLPISPVLPADGQVLVWNQSAGQWEPRDTS